jgi:hypothetical protein
MRLSDNSRQGVHNMRFATKVAIALAFVTLAASAVSAQTPFVAVYFDNTFTQETANCPGLGLFQTLYVVAINFNAFLSGIEYSITYPAALSYIADLNQLGGSVAAGGFTFGSTPVGTSMGFAIPQNGFFPLLLQTVLAQWQCVDCSTAADQQIVVKGHPLFNPLFPRATDFPTTISSMR